MVFFCRCLNCFICWNIRCWYNRCCTFLHFPLIGILATERSILTTSVPVSFGPPTGTVFPFGAAPCLVKKGGHGLEYTHQSRDIFNYLVGTGSRITILLSRMNRSNNNVSLIVSFQLSNCFFCFFFQR